VLNAHETGEAEGGQAEDAQEADVVLQGGDLGVAVEHSTDEDAQHGDLIFKTGEGMGFEVFDFTGVELASVEAVLEGIGVAGLAAAPAGRGRGDFGGVIIHFIIIAQIF